jgi:hypothetical protein
MYVGLYSVLHINHDERRFAVQDDDGVVRQRPCIILSQYATVNENKRFTCFSKSLQLIQQEVLVRTNSPTFPT